MLAVYTWEVNSNSGKPLIFLKEKGVEFEFHYVDVLKFEQHQPEYLKMNPDGTVPTVVHDGKVMTESTQALQYLDAVLPGPSFTPDNPEERYRMRWWATHGAAWAASLSVLGWHAFMGPMVRKLEDDKLEEMLARIPNRQRRIAWSTAVNSTFTDEQLQNARDGVARGVQMMEKRLNESPYFAGDSYSIADMVIFANAYSLPLMHDYAANEDISPSFMDWMKRIYRRLAIAEAFKLGRTPMRERAEEMIKRCTRQDGAA
jgi:glutathione S-transferase/GST-like protein